MKAKSPLRWNPDGSSPHKIPKDEYQSPYSRKNTIGKVTGVKLNESDIRSSWMTKTTMPNTPALALS